MTDVVSRLLQLNLVQNAIISGAVAAIVWWKYYKLDIVESITEFAKSEKRIIDNLGDDMGRQMRGQTMEKKVEIGAKGAGIAALETITMPARFTWGLFGLDIGHASDWFNHK